MKDSHIVMCDGEEYNPSFIELSYQIMAKQAVVLMNLSEIYGLLDLRPEDNI